MAAVPSIMLFLMSCLCFFSLNIIISLIKGRRLAKLVVSGWPGLAELTGMKELPGSVSPLADLGCGSTAGGRTLHSTREGWSPADPGGGLGCQGCLGACSLVVGVVK